MILFSIIFSTFSAFYFFYKNPYFLKWSIMSSIDKYKKDVSINVKFIDFILIFSSVILCAIASYLSSVPN